MEEVTLAPKIRFDGFTDAWEQRYFLDNIKSIIDFRGRTPKKMGLEWSTSGYLALSALNVRDGYIDLASDPHYGNEELYQKWMGGTELTKGQVLFTTEAPMGNVVQVPDNKGYILSQRTVAFDSYENKITDDFLASLLRAPNTFGDLTSLSSGGTAKGISQKSLSYLKVIVPAEIEEQTAIGNFFRTLDDITTLHQRECDKLVNFKKAMLEKIFPKNGEDRPEIRFDGFTGAWEQRELGRIFPVIGSGNRLPKTILEDGDTPYVIATTSNNGILKNIDRNQKDYHGNALKIHPGNSITVSIDNPDAIFLQKPSS